MLDETEMDNMIVKGCTNFMNKAFGVDFEFAIWGALICLIAAVLLFCLDRHIEKSAVCQKEKIDKSD